MLHSSVRATGKEHAPNNEKDKTELETEHNENNAVKVENVQIFQMMQWKVMTLQRNMKSQTSGVSL